MTAARLPGDSLAGSRQVSPPLLLVSVRDGSEAHAALSGGAQLLDVKAPERGSLGRPDPQAVREVLAVRDRLAPQTPVSVALGELRDWTAPGDDPGDWLPPGVQFAKVGLHGFRHRDWLTAWRVLRQKAPAGINWVAAAYVDAEKAASPDVDAVVRAGAAHAAGVLLDTWDKQAGGLLESVALSELCCWSSQVRGAGRLLALAGRLAQVDLARLTSVPMDVFAVRSAACVGGERGAQVSSERVRALREALAAWT